MSERKDILDITILTTHLMIFQITQTSRQLTISVDFYTLWRSVHLHATRLQSHLYSTLSDGNRCIKTPNLIAIKSDTGQQCSKIEMLSGEVSITFSRLLTV